MEVRQFFIVTQVGVVLEEYGRFSDYAAACRAWRAACAAHPLAGCRILSQRLVVECGDAALERRDRFYRVREFFRR